MCFHPLICSGLKPQKHLSLFVCFFVFIYIFLHLTSNSTKSPVDYTYTYPVSDFLPLLLLPPTWSPCFPIYQLYRVVSTQQPMLILGKHKTAMALHFSQKKAKALIMAYTYRVPSNSLTSSHTSLPLLNPPKHTGCLAIALPC